VNIDKFPMVSIIVPARNEVDNIERLLTSLQNLEYENYEIIVVDGQSIDGTFEKAQSLSDAKTKVISEPNKPDKWVGKPWACYTGYKQANGEMLIFTDADTFHNPRSLKLIVQELISSKGFVSFYTTHEFKSFWEYLLTLIFLTISIAIDGAKGTRNVIIANGQYMAFTRKIYEKIGTHKVVSDSITEDMDLAILGRSIGYKPDIIYFPNLVTVRMYKSLGELFEGFSKNMAIGGSSIDFFAKIRVGIFHIWGIGSIVLFASSIVLYSIEEITQRILFVMLFIAIVGYIIHSLVLIITEKTLTEKWKLYQFLHPLFYVVLYIILLYSCYQYKVRKSIIWKGRIYSVQ
jgi:chlorobactene glucosyltransferase